MDRMHMHKRGIVRTNKAKERRKLKKSMRYFTQEDTSNSIPVSGSELIFGKNKKKTPDCDVRKLLSQISETANVTNVSATKHMSPTTNDDRICDTSQCKRKNSISKNDCTLSISSSNDKNPEVNYETLIVNGTGGSFERKKNNDNGIIPKRREHVVKEVSESKKKKHTLKNQDLNTHGIKDLQGINEHDKLVKKVNKKESSCNLQKPSVEEKYGSEHRLCENDFIGSRKGAKEMKDGGHGRNRIKKSKKHNLSEDCKLSLGGRQEISNETGNKINIKTIQHAEMHIVSSPVVESKYLSNQSRISEMNCKSGKRDSPVKHSENKSGIDKEFSLAKKKDGLSEVPNSNNQFEKERKECASSGEVLVNYQQKNTFTGEWYVINSDKLTEVPSPEKRTKRSKMKRKSSIVPEFPTEITTNSYCEQQQGKQINLEDVKENNPDSVREDNCILTIVEEDVKAPKKHHRSSSVKSIDEFSKSSPILVEMSGSNDLPSNPFRSQLSDLKTQQTASPFNLKSNLNWNPSSNICSTENWQVHYGNTEYLSNLEEQMVEVTQASCGQIETTQTGNVAYESNELSLLKDVLENEYPQSVLDNLLGSYHLYDISETEVILALRPSSLIYFNGALKVKVLLGKISVLGYELSHTSKEYTVYSPFGVSLLCLQACDESDMFLSEEQYWDLVRRNIRSVNKISKIQERIMNQIPAFSTLILLKSVSETLISFLHKYYPKMHFPSSKTLSRLGEDSSGTLRAQFANLKDKDLYKQASEWSDLISSILKQTPDEMRVMVCGGKGVGKSTFLRFLVNQSLSKFQEILYIDFDPGQSEFTVPGCVSAVVVKNPLLGPNYTHLTNPERMVYVGQVDISKCCDRYLSCIQNIFNWCCSQPQLKALPWFINTMGFVQGLGVELIVETIRFVKPSDLIQINSATKRRNLPFLLNVENVRNHVSTLHPFASTKESSFRFHLLSSMAETPYNKSQPWGLPANILRDTVLLSYFSQMVVPPAYSLLEVLPHKLPFSGLKLCVSHEKLNFSYYLSAMNGNVVALCKVEKVVSLKPSDPEYPEILKDAPICHCFGFGIVRGVDLKKKRFFIITPVETQNVKLVNCLVLGSINLPNNVYTFQDEALGVIPYVIEGALLPLVSRVRPNK